MVPNGKLLGKQLGDRYPGEEALERAKEKVKAWESTDQQWDERQGPGGRLYGVGQDDDETRILKKYKGDRTTVRTEKNTMQSKAFF